MTDTSVPDGGYSSLLAGTTVVDMTTVMAGPAATMMLADMGANVIKVERPEGDTTRASMGSSLNGGDNNAFLALNRNKRSVVADLKSDSGVATLHRLLEDADVLVDNMRPGAMGRLGLSDDALAGRYPELIVAHLRGFPSGVEGSHRAGYDILAQAESGLMGVTGFDRDHPVKAGVPVADMTAGLHLVIGILGSLLGRRADAQARGVEVSLLTSALSLTVWESTEFLTLGTEPVPLGNHHRMVAPYGLFRAQDGPMILAANTQAAWRGLCRVLDRPGLLADPRFETNVARREHLGALVGELEATLGTRPRGDWVPELEAVGVAAGVVKSVPEVLSDPEQLPDHMLLDLDHPTAGTVRVLGNPVVIGGDHARVRMPPPLLGEHTHEWDEDPDVTDGA